mgnify:CR=1 FL=1
MDELKIRTKLMKGMLSKLISRVILKKTGYKVKIQLNDIDVVINDDVAHVHLDANGEIGITEFKRISQKIGLED